MYTEANRVRDWTYLIGRPIVNVFLNDHFFVIYFAEGWAQVGVEGFGSLLYDDTFRPREDAAQARSYDPRATVPGHQIEAVQLPTPEAAYVTLELAGGAKLWLADREQAGRAVVLTG